MAVPTLEFQKYFEMKGNVSPISGRKKKGIETGRKNKRFCMQEKKEGKKEFNDFLYFVIHL